MVCMCGISAPIGYWSVDGKYQQTHGQNFGALESQDSESSVPVHSGTSICLSMYIDICIYT